MKEGITPEDLAQIYTEMRGDLVAFYRRNLPNPCEAEDFVQRVFERAMAQSELRFAKTFLWLIASGLLKNEYRRHERDPLRPNMDDREWRGVRDRSLATKQALRGTEDTEHSASDANFPDVEHLPHYDAYDFEDADFAAAFDHAVRALDEAPRDAFIVSHLRGLTLREAGAVLGTTHETARARRDAATTNIRKELVR